MRYSSGQRTTTFSPIMDVTITDCGVRYSMSDEEHDDLRSKMVALVSRLYHLAEETRERSQGAESPAATARYWQGVSFGLEMEVGEVLTLIEALTQSRDSPDHRLDDLHANLIELAAKTARLTEHTLERGRIGQPIVATPDYWQGVAFGLTMVVGEVLTLAIDLNKSITP